jgi:hypothetical protein
MKVGDRVKVIRVIKAKDESEGRYEEKKLFVGVYGVIEDILEESAYSALPYPGQIYVISECARSFSADELHLVEPTKLVPKVGDIVYVAGQKSFQKVESVKVMVTFIDVNSRCERGGEYIDIVPPEEIVQHEKDVLIKKQTELMRKQTELMLKTKEVMEEANKVALELSQLDKK